jgi:hypothetical protein
MMKEMPREVVAHPEKISSKLGILYEFGHQIALLNIPKSVLDAIGGRDVLTRELYPEVFDESLPLGSAMNGEWFALELSQDTPIEKVQKLVTRIEDLYEKTTQIGK